MSTKTTSQPVAPNISHTPLGVIFDEDPDWRIWQETKYLPIEIVAAFLCGLNETKRGRLRWSSSDQHDYAEMMVRLGSAVASDDIKSKLDADNGDNITRLNVRGVRAWARNGKLRGLPPLVGTNIPKTAGSGRRKIYLDQEAAIPKYLADIQAELTKDEIEGRGTGRIQQILQDKLKHNGLEGPGEKWLRPFIDSWVSENNYVLKGTHSNR